MVPTAQLIGARRHPDYLRLDLTGNSLPSGGAAMGSAIDARRRGTSPCSNRRSAEINGAVDFHALRRRDPHGPATTAWSATQMARPSQPTRARRLTPRATWWDCPGGPGVAGCATASGVDADPSPAHTNGDREPGRDRRARLPNADHGQPAQRFRRGRCRRERPHRIDGLPVQWSASPACGGSVSPASSAISVASP